MIVRQYNVKQGGEYSSRISLVDENIIPISPYTVIFLNNWISQGAITSKKRTAYELRFFLLHLRHAKPDKDKYPDAPVGIDIIQRALAGEFLTRAECKNFTDACRFKSEIDVPDVIPLELHGNKALQHAIHSAKVSKIAIDDQTKNGRLRTALDFIECLYEEMHGKYRAPEFVKSNYIDVKHELESEKKIKNQKGKDASFEEYKIPPVIYLRLLEIINPDSPDNPFMHSKSRNFLIVQMILETGERRGAINKLKISDCKFEGTGDTIRITRTPNDLDDKRRDKPAQKTQAHEAYVPPEIMTRLDDYIQHQRSRFTASEFHQFVFIAEGDSKGTSGDPLSTKGINYIFKVLSKALGFKIHPHLARHKWNEIFSELTKDMSDAQADKLRKYSMGWNKSSNMVDVYNSFKHAVEVRELRRARQTEITSAGVNDAK